MKMNPSPRRAIVLFLLLHLITLGVIAQDLPRAKPEDVGMSSQRLAVLSATLDTYAKNGQLAGGEEMLEGALGRLPAPHGAWVASPLEGTRG